MHLRKIEIKDFCVLAEAGLLLEELATAIAGRNNIGKTSLIELFRRLLSDITRNFRLDDFSLSEHKDFWKTFRAHQEGKT